MSSVINTVKMPRVLGTLWRSWELYRVLVGFVRQFQHFGKHLTSYIQSCHLTKQNYQSTFSKEKSNHRSKGLGPGCSKLFLQGASQTGKSSSVVCVQHMYVWYMCMCVQIRHPSFTNTSSLTILRARLIGQKIHCIGVQTSTHRSVSAIELGLQDCLRPCQAFIWVVEIWTQVLMCPQQVLLPTQPSPRSRENLWVVEKINRLWYLHTMESCLATEWVDTCINTDETQNNWVLLTGASNNMLFLLWELSRTDRHKGRLAAAGPRSNYRGVEGR